MLKHLTRHLQIVCDKWKAANLKLNTKNWEFFQKELIYLGHTISKKGISTNKKKIEALKNCECWGAGQMCSFIGLCTCYRKIIFRFANNPKPLHRLDEKGKPAECDVPFSELKKSLGKCSCLGLSMFQTLFLIGYRC